MEILPELPEMEARGKAWMNKLRNNNNNRHWAIEQVEYEEETGKGERANSTGSPSGPIPSGPAEQRDFKMLSKVSGILLWKLRTWSWTVWCFLLLVKVEMPWQCHAVMREAIYWLKFVVSLVDKSCQVLRYSASTGCIQGAIVVSTWYGTGHQFSLICNNPYHPKKATPEGYWKKSCVLLPDGM